LTPNQEEALIDSVSSLLTNYLLSQTSDDQDMSDDGIRSGSPTSTQSSSIVEINEFDQLLQRIKAVVDNKLSTKIVKKDQNLTIPNNRRQHLSTLRNATSQDASMDEFDAEQLITSTKKHKFDRSSKSQSFDETNLS
jgi:hypothetical protein